MMASSLVQSFLGGSSSSTARSKADGESTPLLLARVSSPTAGRAKDSGPSEGEAEKSGGGGGGGGADREEGDIDDEDWEEGEEGEGDGPAAAAEALPLIPLTPYERKVRSVLVALLSLGMLGALINTVYVLWTLLGPSSNPASGQGRDASTGAFLLRPWLVGIGSICTGLAVPLTAYDILMHLVTYRSPLQRYYLRVLWMVIVYAVESYAALVKPGDRVYLETASLTYEAYALAAFFRLCLDFLGPRDELERTMSAPPRIRSGKGRRGAATATKTKSGGLTGAMEVVSSAPRVDPRTGEPIATMLAPLCWARPWKLGPEFLWNTSAGVLQYVVVRVATAAAIFGMQAANTYSENSWAATVGYPYTTAAINLSQLWAIYCLVMFAYHLWGPLRPLRALGKFVVIKWIVFVSWWQSVILAAIATSGFLPEEIAGMPREDLGPALQDALICVEMVFAAVAHHIYFSYEDFQRPEVLQKASHLLFRSPPVTPTEAYAGVAAGGGGGGSGGSGGGDGAGAVEERRRREKAAARWGDGGAAYQSSATDAEAGRVAGILNAASVKLGNGGGKEDGEDDGEGATRQPARKSPAPSPPSRSNTSSAFVAPQLSSSASSARFSQQLRSPSQMFGRVAGGSGRKREGSRGASSLGGGGGVAVTLEIDDVYGGGGGGEGGADLRSNDSGGPDSGSNWSAARGRGRTGTDLIMMSAAGEGSAGGSRGGSGGPSGLLVDGSVALEAPGAAGNGPDAPNSASPPPRRGPAGSSARASPSIASGGRGSRAGTASGSPPPHISSAGHHHHRGGPGAGFVSTEPLGLLAAVTDMMLPVDLLVDVGQHVAAAGDGMARLVRAASSRAGGVGGGWSSGGAADGRREGAASGGDASSLSVPLNPSSGDGGGGGGGGR